jgi:hypothetical protein
VSPLKRNLNSSTENSSVDGRELPEINKPKQKQDKPIFSIKDLRLEQKDKEEELDHLKQ